MKSSVLTLAAISFFITFFSESMRENDRPVAGTRQIAGRGRRVMNLCDREMKQVDRLAIEGGNNNIGLFSRVAPHPGSGIAGRMGERDFHNNVFIGIVEKIRTPRLPESSTTAKNAPVAGHT